MISVINTIQNQCSGTLTVLRCGPVMALGERMPVCRKGPESEQFEL
jgi:hypothetical protein